MNQLRQKQLYGGRHNHCMTSPVYRQKVAAINARLAERYKDHPALGMWHISNEYSGACHCPLCQRWHGRCIEPCVADGGHGPYAA